jgi:Putative lumazine-binding
MRRLIILAAVMTLALQAASPEEQAVLATVQRALDALGKHDKELMRRELLPGGMATLIRNGQPVQLHFDAFVDRVGGTARIEERIHDPLVRIDNDIAIVWAPYEFLTEGKLDHCGTDIFSLFRRDGHWLVSSIADNSRSDCQAK